MRKQIFILMALIGAATLESCTSASGPAYDNNGSGGGGGGGGTAARSFRNDVLPILSGAGCTGCHGGNGGLSVGTVGALLDGGDHGPAIVPGDASASNLIRKLSATPPFGARMPLGGPYLADTTIGVIRTWINEGAADN